LETYCKDKAIITVIGMLKDKDYKAMLNLAESFSHKIILTPPRSPRAMTLDDLNLSPNTKIEWIDPFEQAIKKGLSLLDNSSVLLITGSLYLAYPAKMWLKDNL
jgi:dihydrofolate synthase/folylpolyglutamate synthase